MVFSGAGERPTPREAPEGGSKFAFKDLLSRFDPGQAELILSEEELAVFAEAFRVLKPGGRLAVSDVVATAPLPAALATSIAAHAGCIAGAADIASLKTTLEAAGFHDILITVNERSRDFIRDWLPGSSAESYVASAAIQATKRQSP